MPSVSAPAKVLVTGASGFLATHVVRNLLEEGYTVVGTGKPFILIGLLSHQGSLIYSVSTIRS